MKTLKKLLLVAALMTAFTSLEAQDVSPVSFMRMNPYQMNTNVATDLPYNAYFSPYIGNFSVNFQHPRFRVSDLFKFSDLSWSDVLNFARGLSDENSMALNASHNLGCLAFKMGNGMFSYFHNFRVQGTTEFGYSLFKLIAYGEESLLGQDNPTSVDFALDGQAYHEYAFGYQMRINSNLSIGARAKLLFGIFNINTEAFNLTLYPDVEGTSIHLTEDIRMRFSLPRMFSLTDDGVKMVGEFGLADFFNNTGFGFDFGVNWRINNRFSVAAAVNDLGRINWSMNNMMLAGDINDAGQYYDENSFVFDGLTEDQWRRFFKEKEYRQMVFDTLSQYFDFRMVATDKYSTPLTTNFLVRGSFDINAYNRLSLQFQGCFRPDGFQPAVTFAYGGSFFKMIDVCGTYTVMRNSFSNIGVGVGFNLGAFHIYGATSNFLNNFAIGRNKLRDYQIGIVFNIRERESKALR